MMLEIKNCVVAGRVAREDGKKCVRMRVQDYVMVLFANVMLTVCVSVHDPGKKVERAIHITVMDFSFSLLSVKKVKFPTCCGIE
jgi:hypothetical protein